MENKKGIYQKYVIRKIVGWRKSMFGWSPEKAITKPVEGEYFVLRLDNECKDKKHLIACRRAIKTYANEIEYYLPELAKDLRKKYRL